jgi:glycosyltransferase involved in cell wall biosynthesis
VREWWWRIAYSVKARRIIKEKKIDVVLIYNCYETWQVPVLRSIKKAFSNVKVVPIILDGDDPRRDNWGWMRRAAKYSDAFIAMSWWIYQNIPLNIGRPSYHFDGGSDVWRGMRNEICGMRDEKILVHTGALDEWRGLDFMMEVVKRMTARRNDVKFIFCGKSSEKVLRDVFNSNPQVELPGFVSEEEMARICNSADILLNVRDPKHPDNILNYPSKLPHYLSFGRPVVSTRLQSLSPDYGEVVNFTEDDNVEAYIAKVEELLSWGTERKATEYSKIKVWFESRKSWDVMISGLVAWLKGIVSG